MKTESILKEDLIEIGEYSTGQVTNVIRHMPRDLWHFTVTGGEPTLMGEDNFIDIIKSINKWLPNTKILLLTNGRTLGDKEFFQKFAAVKPQNMRIAIPIHGSTAEKHDHITRADGSFKQTMRGISNLLSIQAEVEIRIVVRQFNQHTMDFVSKTIQKMRRKYISTMFIYKTTIVF